MEGVMEEAVSAADANRKFSQLLRSVREGRSYVVTVHGKPVAKIVPIGKHDKVVSAARRILFARLRSQPVHNVGRWTRDELYEDDR
jgi:prevent-host-death family protein